MPDENALMDDLNIYIAENEIPSNEIFDIVDLRSDPGYIKTTVKCRHCSKTFSFFINHEDRHNTGIIYIKILKNFISSHFYAKERRFLCEVINIEVTTNTYSRTIK